MIRNYNLLTCIDQEPEYPVVGVGDGCGEAVQGDGVGEEVQDGGGLDKTDRKKQVFNTEELIGGRNIGGEAVQDSRRFDKTDRRNQVLEFEFEDPIGGWDGGGEAVQVVTSLVGGHEGGEEAVQALAGHVGRQGEDGGAVQATAGNSKTGGTFQVIEQVLTSKSEDTRVLQPSSPDFTGRLASKTINQILLLFLCRPMVGEVCRAVGNI